MRNFIQNSKKSEGNTVKFPFVPLIGIDFNKKLLKSQMKNIKFGKEVQDVRALL